MKKLSILICTLPSRINKLAYLLNRLQPQLTDEVELIYFGDNKSRTVGEKRNNLISLAQGKYVVFIDDDDDVTDDYVSEILLAIEQNVDVINFKVSITINGGSAKDVIYSKEFTDKNLPTHYERSPNHIMCFKTELARQTKYNDISFGEDSLWASQIRHLIKTETNIDKTLYFYISNHATSETLPCRNYNFRQQK